MVTACKFQQIKIEKKVEDEYAADEMAKTVNTMTTCGCSDSSLNTLPLHSEKVISDNVSCLNVFHTNKVVVSHLLTTKHDSKMLRLNRKLLMPIS